MKTGTLLAIILLTVVALTHLLRLIYGINVTIDDWVTPQWLSVLGVIGPGVIAWLLWRESK
jgi:hypothetical protein